MRSGEGKPRGEALSGFGPDLAWVRRQYRLGRLAEADLAPDWATQLGRWLTEAVASGQVGEANAMVLCTASPDGRPSARTVLLKGFDETGLVFFTNYGSRKGRELAANPQVSCVFLWHPLERQVVVCGVAEKIPRVESAAYFASRPRGAQLSAWASPQSAVIGSREELTEAVVAAAERFGPPGEVPLPEHWGGFRVVPETVEFWQGRSDRLHDRLRYRRRAGASWLVERLAP
jgi:pyridoxamine 5'-phosphate oxidase